MKLIKKTLGIILSVLLIISSMAVTAISASAATGNTIYFEKPDDWSDTIYIYYWEGSPKPSSLYDYQFTHVSGNIYSYTCKANFTNFLIDDGQSGKHQTVDLTFPGDGYICKVLSTGRNNNYGNYCNDASWSKYDPAQYIGVSVSATPADSEFVDSVTVTLGVSEEPSGTYSIDGSTPVSYQNGAKITLGADAKVGDVIRLTLNAGSGSDAVSKTFTYTKVSTPSAASMVYFDNSVYNWDEVYIYAYGTKENAEWPGAKMQEDKNGLYYYGFTSAYSSENIIVNNGKDDDSKEQFPKNSGLPIKTGECKLLTADSEWVSFGTPDSKPAGFAYTASGTKFSTDTLNVKIGLKNAVKGTYQVDGGTVFEYTGDTVVSVGQGVIGNKAVKLTLTATNENNVTTSTDYTYTKTFKSSKTTFSSPSDGHTSNPVDGYYGTNPNMQLGKNKTISVDGNPSDWDSSMLVAQGVANDDPRVYMPSAMHEQPWDDYALYAAWDNNNLYFMWEMANTTYVVSPSDNFAASQEARPWRNSIPMYIALSINPEIHADGKAWGTDKTGKPFTNPYVWGCDGGTAKDGGVGFKTNVDTLIAFDSNNSNGGASIFKADHHDVATDNYLFNYDTAIPIGVTSYEKQDNQNGFKIAHDYGALSPNLYGVGGAKGSHTVGDSLSENSNWVDFYDLGYQKSHGFIYEVAIPLSTLGIDKDYIETKGIGAMQILTYGTSGMDSLPYDTSMQDNADVEYSYDPSTSHEKEDEDLITVPLARIGALLPDTVINRAPFEVNFGTDKAGTQGIGSDITLKAEPYNGTEGYNYKFYVNGNEVQNSSKDTYTFKPDSKATYELSVTVTDGAGKTATKSTTINIGDEPVVVTQPPETTPKPTQFETETVPPAPTQYTEPDTSSSEPTTEPQESSQPATTPTDIEQPTNPTSIGQDSTEPQESSQPETVPGPTSSQPYTDYQPGTSGQDDTTPTQYPTGEIIPPVPTESIETTPTEPGSGAATEPVENPTAATDPAEQTPATPAQPQSDNKISIHKASANLKAGSTLQLKVSGTTAKATFTSSNKKVAKVSASGKVTALKKGSAKITATVGTQKLVCKIKVTTNPKAKIKNKAVKKSKVYKIAQGKTLTVKLTGKAKAIKNKYKTSSKKIAKITSKKTVKSIKIKALRKGKATIKIKVNGVKTFTIKVKVV